MKKIIFLIIFLLFVRTYGISQYLRKDSTNYTTKKLTLDEVNLVSSYYNQDGDHSPVLGGIGSEKVNEFSTSIDLKFTGYSNPNYVHTLTGEFGYAQHTAASQAWVSKTGASRTSGNRIFPSLQWSLKNISLQNEYSAGISYSNEYNYRALGLNMGYSKTNKNNGEFAVKLTGSFDRVVLITAETMSKDASVITNYSQISPLNLSDSPYKVISAASSGTPTVHTTTSTSGESEENIASSPRTTLTAAFTYNQVINTRMQMSVLTDFSGQFGFLGLPFHRVFFADADSSKIENLPKSRLKLPVALRYNYFIGDNFILRGYYRFYTDTWGITAHTASLEVPVKLSSFFSVYPFYRFYTQTAAKYFAPYAEHLTSDEYYTSNYDYSAFTSHFYGVGLKWNTLNSTFFKGLEFRYGHYTQTTSITSNVFTIDLKF